MAPVFAEEVPGAVESDRHGDQLWHVDAVAGPRPRSHGNWPFPPGATDAKGRLVLYDTGHRAERYLSASAVLKDEAPADKLDGHVVFIGTSAIGLKDVRRMVAAVARLRGEAVRDVTVRSDARHLKVELESGLILVVSADQDEQGRPRLEVDVVEAQQDASARQQIEVRFD